MNKEAFFKRIGYQPHSAGQWAFHNSQARFRAPCCGRRYGKSTMAGRDLEPELFLPDKRFWIVGPTYDLGEKEFRVIWDDLIIGLKLGHDKRIKKSFSKRQGDMFIEFPWQTRVEVRSAEHPQHLVGERLDGVIMSEAAKHTKDTWERYIRASLADRRGWATFPTTPEGHNWYYDIWRYGRDPNIPNYESWQFPSWDNPVVYPGGREDPEIKMLEATTTPEWFMQEIGADFTAFVGKIYAEFNEMTHVKPCPYNPLWPNYIAFDWGFTHPLAAIEFQVSPRDEIYIWREYYKPYKRLEEVLVEMAVRSQPEGYKISGAFGDAADPEAADYVSTHLIPCMALQEAKQNWRQGVDVVKKFVQSYPTGLYDEFDTPIEEPHLFVDPSCPNTIREFTTYRAKTNRDGTSPKDIAAKIDDHALDALRYALVSLYELGAQHHLYEVYPQAELLDSTAPMSGYFTVESMRF